MAEFVYGLHDQPFMQVVVSGRQAAKLFPQAMERYQGAAGVELCFPKDESKHGKVEVERRSPSRRMLSPAASDWRRCRMVVECY